MGNRGRSKIIAYVDAAEDLSIFRNLRIFLVGGQCVVYYPDQTASSTPFNSERKGPARVAALTNRMYVHYALREASCVLCGAFHEQQYVAAGIFDGDRHLEISVPAAGCGPRGVCHAHSRAFPPLAGASCPDLSSEESLPPQERRRSKAARREPGPKGSVRMPPSQRRAPGLGRHIGVVKSLVGHHGGDPGGGKKPSCASGFSGLLEDDLVTSGR